MVEKGEADPQSLAALTFDDLAVCLTRWIVDAYHNTPHSGLGGKTPRQVWQELVARDGVAPSPDNQRWRMVFGERLIRTLDKRGIVVLGVRYHCEALALWMSRKGEQKLHVRWHPRDLGGIEVYLGDPGRRWSEKAPISGWMPFATSAPPIRTARPSTST